MQHYRTIPGFGPRPGFCASKGRQWFAARGLDWTDFVRNGIDAQVFIESGDHLAISLVKWAKQQEESNGRQ